MSLHGNTSSFALRESILVVYEQESENNERTHLFHFTLGCHRHTNQVEGSSQRGDVQHDRCLILMHCTPYETLGRVQLMIISLPGQQTTTSVMKTTGDSRSKQAGTIL